jgi:short-subunit dehydrogenase
VFATVEDLKASRGCLALIGSVAGYVPLPGTSPYSMSKAAVHALAESFYFELGRHGVAVVKVVPGFIDSEIRQVDNEGVYHPDAPEPIPAWLRMPTGRAARLVLRAIAHRRREVVITGHGRLAVVLKRHFPRTLAFLVRRFGVRGRRAAEG